jgi:hypothetical protein
MNKVLYRSIVIVTLLAAMFAAFTTPVFAACTFGI